MSIQRLHVEKRYSEVVIHNGTVYLAGQLADDFGGDIREQTRQTLANILKKGRYKVVECLSLGKALMMQPAEPDHPTSGEEPT